MSDQPLLQANALQRHYQVTRGRFRPPRLVRALDEASFTLHPGRTLAVVGESGCGKSTLARVVTMIEPPSGGRLEIAGQTIDPESNPVIDPALRCAVQIVFQDPYGSLNPRKKIASILEEPLLINTQLSGQQRRAAAQEMMHRVGLRPEHSNRYPHMFSGGQRQRIAIARALMLKPKIVVLDEPVSALDVSIQAQVLNLLVELQTEFNLAYLFISHDLSVVRHIADEVLVMYLGRVVEHNSQSRLFERPRHPYTQALLSATPIADPNLQRPDRIQLSGELPSPLNPPQGCAFHPRCWLRESRCESERPGLTSCASGGEAACWAPEPARSTIV